MRSSLGVMQKHETEGYEVSHRDIGAAAERAKQKREGQRGKGQDG